VAIRCNHRGMAMIRNWLGKLFNPRLAVGDAIPTVQQVNQDGDFINLAEAAAAGYLLVYFYPKADTPGCTQQACSLRDAFAELSDLGIRTFGVSMDRPAAQKAFKAKYRLPFDLLADSDGTLVRAFGVPNLLGLSKRQAFLFKAGKLVWADASAATAKQAQDVLKYLHAQPSSEL
jgi:thioredoxin-dependent peroxiredoxin